ncbi:MAG: sulfopyruvate decarboxylase subunit alpha [Chloroflexi bacterium]|nr:sulfopyruvate decarboxylase subunit alpha [Chloroflexota bacterium]
MEDELMDARLVLQGIKAAGINLVASLPDQNLVDLIEMLEQGTDPIHVPLAREEEGIGVATGAYMAGGMPAVLMQNAGFLNACNALTTTALQFEVPMVLLIYYAGYLGDKAFMRLGEVTEPVLQGLKIRYFIPPDSQAATWMIPDAAVLAKCSYRPVAVLLTKYVLRRFK